ncbi:hypothetical protein LSAC_01126 [Levilinea saccharolytica]|nr:hypothetical protein LSAC_01126 [Levilinea saccharolytica]
MVGFFVSKQVSPRGGCFESPWGHQTKVSRYRLAFLFQNRGPLGGDVSSPLGGTKQKSADTGWLFGFKTGVPSGGILSPQGGCFESPWGHQTKVSRCRLAFLFQNRGPLGGDVSSPLGGTTEEPASYGWLFCFKTGVPTRGMFRVPLGAPNKSQPIPVGFFVSKQGSPRGGFYPHKGDVSSPLGGTKLKPASTVGFLDSKPRCAPQGGLLKFHLAFPSHCIINLTANTWAAGGKHA